MSQRGDFSYGDENIDPAEEVLTVEAAFVPLLQETMSKSKEPSFLVNMKISKFCLYLSLYPSSQKELLNCIYIPDVFQFCILKFQLCIAQHGIQIFCLLFIPKIHSNFQLGHEKQICIPDVYFPRHIYTNLLSYSLEFQH